MSTSFTSKEAYRSIRTKLGEKQRAVYQAIKELGAPNNEQIADHLDWPINCVTGRVSELRYKGMVAAEGISFSKTGRKTKAWSICDLNDKNLIELDCES